MAGQGAPPKDPAQRRRRNEPARGEWKDLAPFGRREARVLPIIGKIGKAPPDPETGRGVWSPRTKKAWNNWRDDPATREYGPAEIQAAIDAIFLYEELVRGNVKLAAELRLRLDGLGLTAKGKRDLRWRLATDEDLPQPHGAAIERKRSTRTDRRARLELRAN